VQIKRKAAIVSLLVLMPLTALALDFRSIAAPKATLYDAPSAAATKVLLLSQNYPVEVVVNLGDWLKVRDAQGSLNWVESKNLSNKRTMLITQNNAEIRQSADAASTLLATVEKDVLLEVADTKFNRSQLKVKHRDGLSGYILLSSTWGYQ